MDISKLTIQGFKSFYEKSTFTFGKNITGIVGPNGSGKSNITEAIRFVLGEQSTKSMRGKDATDLLYRGNSVRASKAKVEVEFTKPKFVKSSIVRGNIENIFVKNALEKDTVTVSRTIYQDGKSEYEMNGVEVRLKDLHEFLLYIHLGNKSSWHISQGEADRVLTANSQDRKALIEDALGLKVYHARINDSLRKLEKTKENIREATIKRREIMPELNILQKSVERIRRGDEYRKELSDKASIYLSVKNKNIEALKKEQENEESINDLKLKLEKLTEQIVLKEKSLYKDSGHDVDFLEQELRKEEKVLVHLQNQSTDLNNRKRSIDNNFDYLKIEEKRNLTELEAVEKEIKEIHSSGNDIVFSEGDINSTKESIENNTEKILATNDLQFAKNLSRENDLSYKQLITKGSVVNKDNVKQISYLQNIKSRLQEKIRNSKAELDKINEEQKNINPELENLNLKIKLSNEKYEEINKQILEFKYKRIEAEAESQKLIYERRNLEVKLEHLIDWKNKVDGLKHDYDNELSEFKSILGPNFNPISEDKISLTEDEIASVKRNIERLKIRLEESQVANGDEVIRNFEEMTERDAFLVREISDLESSMQNLSKLISDLKDNLHQEFELGLKHIDTVFDSYVKKLFGGGTGKVFLVEIEKKNKKTDEDEMEEAEDGEVKTGVEVEVEIPKKKIKGLQSLSGGERALVSIALNFSIIHQNPAPFMILDETDATLDEANAKRYGEILSILKENTKLIVVTHNRETMHFADQVYGVTLSKEGHSKVLSVSFEDAIEYAK